MTTLPHCWVDVPTANPAMLTLRLCIRCGLSERRWVTGDIDWRRLRKCGDEERFSVEPGCKK